MEPGSPALQADSLPTELSGKTIPLCTLCYAKSLQSCPTLCDPIDNSPPGSPVPGILQARTLEWVAISFSNAWKWNVKGKSLSRVRLFATPWTAAYEASLFHGIFKARVLEWGAIAFSDVRCITETFWYSYTIMGQYHNQGGKHTQQPQKFPCSPS